MSDVICVLSQSEALAQIKLNLRKQKVVTGVEGKEALKSITETTNDAIDEVLGDGLTDETCGKVSESMLAQEADTRTQIEAFGVPVNLLREHVGLMLLHQTMQHISKSEGINEGPKPCEPWC